MGHFRELNADTVGVHGALQMISLFAQVLYEQSEASDESLLLPRAALTRTARLLDASAQMIRDGAVVSPDLERRGPLSPTHSPETRARFVRSFARTTTECSGPAVRGGVV